MLTALIVLVTLTVLTQLETVLKVRQAIHTLDVEVQEEDRGPARVLDSLCTANIVVLGITALLCSRLK